MLRTMKQALFAVTAVLSCSCFSGKHITHDTMVPAALIIYKTKNDYTKYLPITLNNAKDRIISFPSPGDIFYNGKLALPDKLKKGYYLDNRGISPNSVFTSFTYEEYSKLEKAPELEDLMKSIIDLDPFLEFYECGNRGDLDRITKLNELIENNFKNCKRIK